MRFVDANVILRYLLEDDLSLAEKAAIILEREKVHVPFEVVAEVVYVMEGVYKGSPAGCPCGVDTFCRVSECDDEQSAGSE